MAETFGTGEFLYSHVPDWEKLPDGMAFKECPGVAVDSRDNVYVLTRGEHPIIVFDKDGNFIRTFGEGHFSEDRTHGLYIAHDDSLLVADDGIHTIQKFGPEGDKLMEIGEKNHPAPAWSGQPFNRPTSAAIMPSNGDVYVSDGYGNRRIVHFDKEGKCIKTWGQYGSTPGRFVLPHAIVLDSEGRLYVADRNSARIQIFDQEGNLLDQWSNMIMPWGMSITDDDVIWVCGSSPHWWLRNGEYPEYKDQLFMRFKSNGHVQQVWSIPLGDIGTNKDKPDVSRLKPGEAVGVHCIAQDSKGNLYVGDIYGERAQKFVPITTRPQGRPEGASVEGPQ